MKFDIKQNPLTEQTKKRILSGFGEHALETTGVNGLSEDPVVFEIFKDEEFAGAVVVQLFWGQLHIKNLFVEKRYRGQNFGRKLMERAFAFGKEKGCTFAFVETCSFQAPKFYQKLGFTIEFSRAGYTEGTSFHYLKKSLSENERGVVKQITRTGVYGVAKKGEKILVIRQKNGPYAGKFDFPGGGIEFGESAKEALRREFLEEISMEFDSMHWLDNLTAKVEVPATDFRESYDFFQIGLIYEVKGYRPVQTESSEELEQQWINLRNIPADGCSALLDKYRLLHF